MASFKQRKMDILISRSRPRLNNNLQLLVVDMSYRAYKYRLFPTVEQATQLNRWFAAVRLVYNAALEQRKMYGRTQGTDPHGRNSVFSSARQGKELNFHTKSGRPGLKGDLELSWISETPSDSLHASLRDLDKAFDKFFKGKVGFPSFRNEDRNNSVSFPANATRKFKGRMTRKPNVIFGQNSVRLPKLGRVRYKRHKKFYGEPKTVDVIREGDEFYVILVTKHLPKVSQSSDAIGVDLGVCQPVTLSNGEYVPRDYGLEALEQKTRKEQRKLSRKKKGSKRREKQKRHVASIRRKQARRRAANSHRITTDLTRRFGLIAIENLKVKNMTASGGSRKKGLNRAILNVAPYQFRQQLEYKGSKVVAVNPAYTSQMCSCCGHVSSENRKTQSEFKCVECGLEDHADVNAAINILMRANPSAGAAARRKASSELQKKSAALKGNVSSYEPPEGKTGFEYLSEPPSCSIKSVQTGNM